MFESDQGPGSLWVLVFVFFGACVLYVRMTVGTLKPHLGQREQYLSAEWQRLLVATVPVTCIVILVTYIVAVLTAVETFGQLGLTVLYVSSSLALITGVVMTQVDRYFYLPQKRA